MKVIACVCGEPLVHAPGCPQKPDGDAYKFRNSDMAGICAEAVVTAYSHGEDGNVQALSELTEGLLVRVRNYMLTGDPNGTYYAR